MCQFVVRLSPLSHQQCPCPQVILPCLVQPEFLRPEKTRNKSRGEGWRRGLNVKYGRPFITAAQSAASSPARQRLPSDILTPHVWFSLRRFSRLALEQLNVCSVIGALILFCNPPPKKKKEMWLKLDFNQISYVILNRDTLFAFK